MPGPHCSLKANDATHNSTIRLAEDGPYLLRLLT